MLHKFTYLNFNLSSQSVSSNGITDSDVHDVVLSRNQ